MTGSAIRPHPAPPAPNVSEPPLPPSPTGVPDTAGPSVPDAADVHRWHREKGLSPAQIRLLIALSHRETPCTAAELTDSAPQGSTVRTLQCLAAKALVHSEMIHPDGKRPAPVYALTEHGRALIAHLLATTPVPERATP